MDLHVVGDVVSEALADFRNRSGGAADAQRPPERRALSAASADLLPPLELAVIMLIVAMLGLGLLYAVAVLCDLPYPGRAEAEIRRAARARTAAANQAWIAAEAARREAGEREEALRGQLKASVSPNVAWGGTPERRRSL